MTSQTVWFSHRGYVAARNGITHSCVLTLASSLPICKRTRHDRVSSEVSLADGSSAWWFGEPVKPHIVCWETMIRIKNRVKWLWRRTDCLNYVWELCPLVHPGNTSSSVFSHHFVHSPLHLLWTWCFMLASAPENRLHSVYSLKQRGFPLFLTFTLPNLDNADGS